MFDVTTIHLSSTAITATVSAYDTTGAAPAEIAASYARAHALASAATARLGGDRAAFARVADHLLSPRNPRDLIGEVACLIETTRGGWHRDRPVGEVSGWALSAARRCVATYSVASAARAAAAFTPPLSWAVVIMSELGLGAPLVRVHRAACRAHGLSRADARKVQAAGLPNWAELRLEVGRATAGICAAGAVPEQLGVAHLGVDGQWAIRPTGPAAGYLSPQDGADLLRAVNEILR